MGDDNEKINKVLKSEGAEREDKEKKILTLIILTLCCNLYSQNDTIQGEAEYRKIYDCRYEPGNILIVQKKLPGKQVQALDFVMVGLLG